jgi:hypothetical protein
LFSFFAKCPYNLDHALEQLLSRSLELVFVSPFLIFEGFSDNKRFEQVIINQICHSLHLALLNRNLENLHQRILLVVNNPANLVLWTISQNLVQLDVQAGLNSVMHLCAHLDNQTKQ